MVKRYGAVFLIFLVTLLSLCSCARDYEGWKEETIPEVGSIKIPEDMVLLQEDKALYLMYDGTTDKSDAPVVGVVYDTSCSPFELLSNILNEEIVLKEDLAAVNYSNSATIGNILCLINGELCEKNKMRFFSGNGVTHVMCAYFLFSDDSIDYDLMDKITKSYVAE